MDAPAMTAVPSTGTRLLDNYVGGAWVPATAPDALDVTNPAAPPPAPGLPNTSAGGAGPPATAPDALDVTNPATGETLARVPLSARADLDAAVQAARDALPAWRAVSVIGRAQKLFALREG